MEKITPEIISGIIGVLVLLAPAVIYWSIKKQPKSKNINSSPASLLINSDQISTEADGNSQVPLTPSMNRRIWNQPVIGQTPGRRGHHHHPS